MLSNQYRSILVRSVLVRKPLVCCCALLTIAACSAGADDGPDFQRTDLALSEATEATAPTEATSGEPASTAAALLGNESAKGNRHADYFISSQASNQLMLFNEITGNFLGVVREVSLPAASQIGFGGDLFLAAAGSGEVLRFDGYSGRYKGVFIHAGSGGLTTPSAPNFGPDGLVYVGDTTTHQELRYDANGKFLDVIADQNTSGLTTPLMQVFDDTSIYIASRDTNSILRYDLKTKAFLGAFVTPGSGGLMKPVGLDFGPDGNLFASSSGTGAVLRYDRKTGAFMDAFVPPGTAGLSDPRAVRFGGPNSNLYVVSSGNNQVLEFDRLTGAFVRIVADGTADGVSGSRGLTFTPRPMFHVYANRASQPWLRHDSDEYLRVAVEHRLQDFSDRHPRVQLRSIVASDPSVNLRRAVRGADYGTEDYEFELSRCNRTGKEQRFRIEYIASNDHGLTTIASTEVAVPPNDARDSRGESRAACE